MKLTTASPKDLDAILVLLQEREGKGIDREQVTKQLFLDGSAGYALIVKENNRVVALSAFEKRDAINSDGKSLRCLYWQDLYVAEEQRNGRAYILITSQLRKAVKSGDIDRVYCVVHRQNVLPMHFARGFKEVQKYNMYISRAWLSLMRRRAPLQGEGNGRAATSSVINGVLTKLNTPQNTGQVQARWTRKQLSERLKGRLGHQVILVRNEGELALFSERRIARFIHAYFPLTRSGRSQLHALKRQSRPGLCLFFNIQEESEHRGLKWLVVRKYSLISLSKKVDEDNDIAFEFIEHDAI